MDRISFFSKWVLRIGIGIAIIYDLFIQNWVGIAGGLVILLVTYGIDIINKNKKIISDIVLIIFYIYCIFALICGVMLDFYDYISWWDLLMHLCAGIVLGIVGNKILNALNGNRLNPLLRLLFIAGFAIMCGVFWEIYEFAADIVLKTDMQCVVQTGVADTMGDLISDLIGGVVVGIFSMIISKK